MTAFYGIPEGDECKPPVKAQQPVEPVEPTDDPQLLLGSVHPQRFERGKPTRDFHSYDEFKKETLG